MTVDELLWNIYIIATTQLYFIPAPLRCATFACLRRETAETGARHVDRWPPACWTWESVLASWVATVWRRRVQSWAPAWWFRSKTGTWGGRWRADSWDSCSGSRSQSSAASRSRTAAPSENHTPEIQLRPSFEHAGLTCYTLLSPLITFSLFRSKLKTYLSENRILHLGLFLSAGLISWL